MKKINISFILIVLIGMLSGCSHFDQATWQNDVSKRESMISSLETTYALKGMSTEEVINLLGEPEQKLTEPSTEFLYYLGGAGLMGIKVSLFQLQFDDNGRLESYDIIAK